MKLQDKDIERLVEKYYEGTSSEQEELLLRSAIEDDEFNSHPTMKYQFYGMKALREEPGLGSDFDKMIVKKIKSASPKRRSIKRTVYSVSTVVASMAAVLLIWFGSGLFQPNEVYGTVTDPIVAFHETRMAMEEVSAKLNKGLKPAKKSVEALDTNVKKAATVGKIEEAMDKAKKIKKMERASELLRSINKVYIDLGNSKKL